MLILETSVLPIKLCPRGLQMEGIEPSSMDFQSTALPTKLHLRLYWWRRKMGLEPIFLWSQHKVFPVKLLPPRILPDWNRTNNLLLIRQALYRLSYRQFFAKLFR